MLATEILTQDHSMAIGLIEQLEGVTTEGPEHQEIFNELDEALRLHIRVENEIYYPALEAHQEFEGLMDENIPEHEMVKENFAQMSELAVSDETFQSILAETRAALEVHMDNEEDDLFPRSIEVLGADRIEELGREIEQMKGENGMSQSAGM